MASQAVAQDLAGLFHQTPVEWKMPGRLSQPEASDPQAVPSCAHETSSFEHTQPPPDKSIPRRLAPDFFLGQIEAAKSTELLLALGIRRVLFALPDPAAPETPVNTGSPVPGEASSSVAEATLAAAVTEAAAVASTVGVEACIVQRSREALNTGQASALLLEVCRWIEEGLESGCVLVSGPLAVPGAPAVWFAAAFLAATANASLKQPVVRAFASCRAAFPSCRMSAVQAEEALLMLPRWRLEGARVPQRERARRKGAAPTDAVRDSGAGASHWLMPCSSACPTCVGSSTHGGGPTATAETDSAGLPELFNGVQLDGERTAPALQQRPQPQLHNTVALVTVATAIALGETPSPGSNSSAAVEAIAVSGDGTVTETAHAPQPKIWYRCRKCRTPIFSGSMLEVHEEGKGQTAFKYSRRDARAANVSGCTSHFLNPDATSTLSEIEGKICCPRCSARIGGYHWAGMQCSCGAWVAPAVQVVKSKVDESMIMTPPTPS